MLLERHGKAAIVSKSKPIDHRASISAIIMDTFSLVLNVNKFNNTHLVISRPWWDDMEDFLVYSMIIIVRNISH